MASLIRNIYETVGLFNLIFRVNRLGDERLIVYNLWVISGLKYRQRFSSLIHSEENRIKLDTEQKNIETYIQEIENTILYKKLDDRNKAKIQNQIKQKEYLLHFVNDQVIILNWKDLYKTIGGKEDFFNNLYTFFSLYTHPSNVAVFQFRDMYLPETKSFVKMTTFNLKYFYMLGSIFVADYIYLFPDSLKTYDALPLMNQIIINFHNTFARGDSSSINDSWKALG